MLVGNRSYLEIKIKRCVRNIISFFVLRFFRSFDYVFLLIRLDKKSTRIDVFITFSLCYLSLSLPPPALPNFTAFSFAFFHTQPPFIQTHAHAHKKNKSETELLHRIYLIIMKKDGNKMKREKNTHTKNYGALLMFLFLNLFFVLFFLLLLFRLHVG